MTDLQQRNNSKKKKIVLFGLLFSCLLWGFLTYAWLLGGSSYSYLPASYSSDNSIRLSLTAKGNNTAMDYYPGWYAIIPSATNGKRILSSLEIESAPIQSNEIFSGWVPCNSSGQPSGCYDIIYRFLWTDAVTGKELRSNVNGSTFSGNSWYVDVISEILKNIQYFDWSNRVTPWSNEKITWIQVSNSSSPIVLKTYWADDIDFNGNSDYEDISKKFVLRTIESETYYLGIAKSNPDLWTPKNTTWATVKPADMWKLNFATLNVQPGGAGLLKYRALIPKGKNYMRVITVDMDNIDYDINARPEMHSYIDFYLKKNVDGERKNVDKHNDINSTWEPIARVAPNDNSGKYPVTDPTKTDPLEWPSGNFLCDWGTIWSPWFFNQQFGCYYKQTNGFKWITQYTINFDAATEDRIMYINLNNISGYVGNSFAIAGDVDFIEGTKPPTDIVDEPQTDTGSGATDGTGSGTSIDGIIWKTYVEVDLTGTWDGENWFDDDGKTTNIGALHTYKTEVCNTTQTGITNVMLKLNRPDNSFLIDETSTGTTTSSLFLSWSFLEASTGATQLPIAVFNTDISIWDLWAWACQFITYQTIVGTGVVSGDVLKVKNQFKYGTKDYADTNEVSNPITDNTYDIDIKLVSIPESDSEVYNKDFITYTTTIKNTWLSDIGTGSITCGRFIDTPETECKTWNCTVTYPFYNFLRNDEISVVYTVQVKDSVVPGTIIPETCSVEYEKDNGDKDSKISNQVQHRVVKLDTMVSNGSFSLYLDTAPKLLNSPDGNPRPDGWDKSLIKYQYQYTGSKFKFMYPDQSSPGSYVLSRGRCGSMTLPYTPNSISYNINSSDTSPRNNLSLSSKSQLWNITTTLPNGIPKTTLSNGSLTPYYYQAGSSMNQWFSQGWLNNFPSSSTEHRALVQGTNGMVNATIVGTVNVDTWQYVNYTNGTCSYSCRCTAEGWCDTCYRSYPRYRWERVDSKPLIFTASNKATVTVWVASAFFKTTNGQVHTNNKITWDGTSANTYKLGLDGTTTVVSPPKLYSPPGSYHWDYIVSSNSSDTNLKSKVWRYLYNKNIPMWHGYVYDRENNKRDFYDDILVKEKYGKVIKTWLQNPVKSLDLDLNTIYYYPGDLTIYNAAGDVKVKWQKATILVGGDLYIKSNLVYDLWYKTSTRDALTMLWVIVRWDIYISPNVTDTVWVWHVDRVLHTWDSVYQLRHLGQWTAWAFDLERKAPEHYEREVNEPAEHIDFYNLVYYLVPPGFGELDDWIWARKFNINQFSWKEVDF